MHRLVRFLKLIYIPLIFVILELMAFNYYASSDDFRKAKLLTASNGVVGWMRSGIASVTGYFGLRSENDILLEELAKSRNEIETYRKALSQIDPAGVSMDAATPDYFYSVASVVDNSVTRQENMIVIDKGKRDGIDVNMALVTPQGNIAGYIMSAGENFSSAISILNTNFRTGGKIMGKDSFGSIRWEGTDSRYVTLSEIPQYARPDIGDTVVTGYSSIFPPDIRIGYVEDMELNASNYYDVKIRLAAPMTGIKRLFVVDYASVQERLLFEEENHRSKQPSDNL